MVCSGEIVTRFYATWTAPQMAAHVRAADQVGAVAREAFAAAGARLAQGGAVMEHEVQAFVMDRFAELRLEFDHDPIVAAGRERRGSALRAEREAAARARSRGSCC